MNLLGEHGAAPAGGAAPKDAKSDKRKQTILVLASIVGVALTYLLYRRAQANGSAASTATTPTSATGTDTSGDDGDSGDDSDDTSLLQSIGSQLGSDEATMTALQSDITSLTKSVSTDTTDITGLTKLSKTQGTEITTLKNELSAKAKAATKATSTTKKPTASKAAASSSEKSYTVKSGDTLTAIAEKYKESLSTLESQNAKAIKAQGNNNLIHPGLKLKVK